MRTLLFLLLVTVLVTGCPPDFPQCQPRQQQACLCPSGAGVQVCSSAGDWMTCQCPESCKDGDKRKCGFNKVEGVCRRGEQVCKQGRWSSCEGEVLPVAEICNGSDDDCDGRIDEDMVCGQYPTNSGQPCLFVKNLKKAKCDDRQGCSCYITPDGKEWTCFGETSATVRWMTLNQVQAMCGREGLKAACGGYDATCMEVGRLDWMVSGLGFLKRVYSR